MAMVGAVVETVPIVLSVPLALAMGTAAGAVGGASATLLPIH